MTSMLIVQEITILIKVMRQSAIGMTVMEDDDVDDVTVTAAADNL